MQLAVLVKGTAVTWPSEVPECTAAACGHGSGNVN